MVAELLGRTGADDLIDGILDDGRREACGDVLDARALLLGLLDRAVHEHGTARAELHGMLREEAEAGEGLDLHAHGLGKGLDEGAAPRRTGLVEHDGINGAVLDFEAFDILPADVDDEVHVGVEIQGGLEMGHRLHDAEVNLQGRFEHVLAVARHARPADDDATAAQPIDLFQPLLDDLERLAVVGLIMRVEDLVVGRDEHELGRRRARVDAEVGVPFVLVDVLEFEVAPLVASDEIAVFLPRGKERLPHRDVARIRDVPDAGDNVV